MLLLVPINKPIWSVMKLICFKLTFLYSNWISTVTEKVFVNEETEKKRVTCSKCSCLGINIAFKERRNFKNIACAGILSLGKDVKQRKEQRGWDYRTWCSPQHCMNQRHCILEQSHSISPLLCTTHFPLVNHNFGEISSLFRAACRTHGLCRMDCMFPSFL